MPGFDWNGNGKKDSFDDFMDMKAMSDSSKDGNRTGGSNKNGGAGFGCGWVVIVLVVIMLIFFIADGASWDAIDSLLGLGLLAFLFFRWIST